MATTAVSSPQKQAEILLESGTNELEVLVFCIGNQAFGVNVAKVREVITPRKVSASPGQPPCVKGVFNLRNVVLPLVDLHLYLNIQPHENDPKDYRIIVMEFNGVRTAYQVESVESIYRMSWQLMKPVPETYGRHHFAVTGITEINDRLILMLDFESIHDHICMQDDLHVERVENKLGIDRSRHNIMLAEDSSFVMDIMRSVLINSGYGRIDCHTNGLSAWNALNMAISDETDLPDLIITDIEMPQVDGLHLTKRIKEHPRMRDIPVLLFSSLITTDTRHKGKQVHADDQISKPDLPNLVDIVDQWMQKKK